ncbi:PDZ/DHR/GLGF domain protein [Kribbella flavida DSM 17836]|uniref:PDZ/DHR/GLGF domain protein n=1 Tax=Kribbella flavida (strain DSM 17836 / JCM 10339 / NBRC 14399) TaxID=479435 RepID=D2PMC1_KRIFD|nr:PDZ/DHR/GLGF domain protein [Kribbella flavida DSM 17836]
MSWDDAEPTVRTPRDPADPEPTRELPADRPVAGPVVPPAAPEDAASGYSAAQQSDPGYAGAQQSDAGYAGAQQSDPGAQQSNPAVSALTPPPSQAGSAPLAAPGGAAAYRQSERSMTQRSFGRPEQVEPGFRPVYQGQAWPTQQPGYVPPPPIDWHQQQARAYTPAPPPKGSRVILIAGIVALVIGLIAGAGAAATVVALDGRGPIDEPAGPPIGTGADPKIRSGSVSAVAQTLLPSVVQLKVEGADNSNGTGSGFVIDTDGHILTNNHVVSAAAQGGSIQVVTQQGKTATARLVGRSPAYDLAVVQVSGIDAPSVQFGRSDLAIVGQDVVAIGSPLGLAGTVTSGIVSAKNRPVTAGGEGEISYINALQTDAAINPGNSGGPLVDMNARVIGVNSAIATVRGAEEGSSGNIGLGFAIPIDQARRTAQQLIATGKASYPVIGANVDMRFEGGARVSEVTAGSPAARAGLRTGDVVTSIDNQTVDTAEALIVAIRTHRPGESVRLVYQRAGKARQATVTLGQQTG